MTTQHGRLPLPNDLALDMAQPFVPPGLIAPAAWEALRRTASAIPRGFGFGCIEVRLDDDPQVDLLLCATAFEHNRETLGDEVSRNGPGPLAAITPLLSDWTTPGNIIHDEMPQLWIEIDHPGGVPREAFAHVRIAPYAMTTPWPVPRPPEEAWELTRRGVARMAKVPLPPEDLGRLRRLFTQVPDHSVLMYVNVPASRADARVRCEFAMHGSSVVPTLKGIGWSGPLERVEELIGTLPEREARQFSVLFTIGGGEVLPTVSLEPAADPEDPVESWRRVFAVAGAHGGACDERVSTLHLWAGSDPVDHPSLGWPGAIDRGFDFKFVVAPDGTVRSKAYLVYHPRFRLMGGPTTLTA